MIYKAGQFLNLFVVSVNPSEIVLEDKNKSEFTLLPTEQMHRLSVGAEVMVILYIEGEQLMASMRLEHHANKDLKGFKENQKVNLYVIRHSDLGYSCLIDGHKMGMLYNNEVFKRFEPGTQVAGYIKKIRPDHKIDLLLREPGHKATLDIGENILKQLEEADGFLPITDKTSAEKIYELFGESKKKFKIALGGLYKKRLINVEQDGIRLVRK